MVLDRPSMKPTIKILALVFIGGAIGSALRYAIGIQLEDLAALVAVNSAGTFALGFVNARKRPDWVTNLFGVGFAGGFTTMSGVSVLLATASAVSIIPLLASVAAMVFAGIFSYWLGQAIGKERE